MITLPLSRSLSPFSGCVLYTRFYETKGGDEEEGIVFCIDDEVVDKREFF
jgi:hypothetical protein